MSKKKEPCPNCGHCPECGRSNTLPVQPYPWTYPYPHYFGPWWQVQPYQPYGPCWTTVTGTITSNPATGTITSGPFDNVTLT